jgi:hypothetical protein
LKRPSVRAAIGRPIGAGGRLRRRVFASIRARCAAVVPARCSVEASAVGRCGGAAPAIAAPAASSECDDKPHDGQRSERRASASTEQRP